MNNLDNNSKNFEDDSVAGNSSKNLNDFEVNNEINNSERDFQNSRDVTKENQVEMGNDKSREFSENNDFDNFDNKSDSRDEVEFASEPDFESFNFQKYKNIFDNHGLDEGDKSDFEWDYEKYSQMDKLSKGQSGRSRGAKNFALMIGSLLLISAVSFFGFELSGLRADFIPEQIDLNLKNTATAQENSLSMSNAVDNNAVLQGTTLISNNVATQVAQKVMPAVVSIKTYERYQSFYQFGMTDTGGGSGSHIGNGYILTNAHVILNLSYMAYVDAVKVVLSDGREYEAQITACDPHTDIAILKIDEKNLPVAEFGNSDNLKIGETVYAVGSPSGLKVTSFTSGVVSAIDVSSESNLTVGNGNKYIITDAAINPGNSGGPLVNQNGQVIGINSKKLSGQAIEGIGFAIPINQARSVIDDLLKYGYVHGRVKLGIKISREIDEITARLNNVKTGLLIDSVEETSDLASKGIQKYDILHKINNVEVLSVQQLKDQLVSFKPGDTVELIFLRYDEIRGGQEIKVNVRLMEDKGMANSK